MGMGIEFLKVSGDELELLQRVLRDSEHTS
jgi:hypothetical protein